MGYKISAILGGLLLVSIAGSAWYIDRLLDEISTLKGNQLILETEISAQNKSIELYKQNAAKSQQEITSLTKKNQDSVKEVNKLRDTFARHDLDELALAKPGMIQTRVNNGTKRVKEDLINLTTPEQYE